jgi:hypothetical protein
MTEKRNTDRVLVGKPDGHLENPGIERNIVLKRIVKKTDGTIWPGLIWLRFLAQVGPVAQSV